jgi:ABC-type oligopeptide transport system substrate-binding subunit
MRLNMAAASSRRMQTISAGRTFPNGAMPRPDQLIAQQANTMVISQRKGAMGALQLLLAEELPSNPLYLQPNVTAASNRQA